MESSLPLVTQSVRVDELYSRIKKDPCYLKNVDVLPFIQTPLHEASSTGEMDLAMELMILMPSFSKKLNEDGFSPLHLAVENQQVELAQELVKFDPSLVRVRGREGKTALHLVAKIGNVDLLTEFLQACPESIRDANVNGETALHIAVLNKKYEELKVLTGWLQRRRKSDAVSTEFHVLNRRDRKGNTALHLAVKENDHKAVEHLLKCMYLNPNIQNKDNETALDVLQAKDDSQMNRATEKIIQKSAGRSSSSKVKPLSIVLRTPVTLWEYCETGLARYMSSMSDGARNALLVITALIITATYQTAVQPVDKDQKDEISLIDVLSEIVLLWGFQTSVGLTFILLPVGRAYTCWYTFLMVPLVCSYGFSVWMKYSLEISFYLHLMVGFGFLIYSLVFYVRWKFTKQHKVPNPKCRLLSESLETMV